MFALFSASEIIVSGQNICGLWDDYKSVIVFMNWFIACLEHLDQKVELRHWSIHNDCMDHHMMKSVLQ